MDALTKLVTGSTSQQEKKFATNQAQNNAGGYVYTITPHSRLERFLLLGTDGGTYYVSEETLTKDNAEFLFAYIRTNSVDVIDTVVDVLKNGRAVRRNACLFALAAVAAAANTPQERSYALQHINTVITTAADLFVFVSYLKSFSGLGRGKRQYIAEWYTSKTPDELALQLVKYRSRAGYTHKDVLRLTHPKTDNSKLNNVFSWVTRGEYRETLPELIRLFTRSSNLDSVIDIVAEHRVPWEILPTESLNNPIVWKHLVQHGLPIQAMIRNISRFEKLDLFHDTGFTKTVVASLTNQKALVGAKIHPMQILFALTTYSTLDSATPAVLDALDQAFYLAFKALPVQEDTRVCVALDVSGSMGYTCCPGSRLSARDASAAMAMTLVHQYPISHVYGFCDKLASLHLSTRQRLDDIVRMIDRLDFGATDCALPMLYATENKLFYDAFIVFTDNETWYGKVHPVEALTEYRKKINPKAKLIVAATDATPFTIADPDDTGTLDIVGFDVSIPTIINNFIQ